MFSVLMNSRSGRWWRLSCGRGCRPCWGCWRCPAEGWRVAPRGCPGWWVYAAGLHLPPWRCSRPWWSDSSLDETSLEGRSDRLRWRNNRHRSVTGESKMLFAPLAKRRFKQSVFIQNETTYIWRIFDTDLKWSRAHEGIYKGSRLI